MDQRSRLAFGFCLLVGWVNLANCYLLIAICSFRVFVVAFSFAPFASSAVMTIALDLALANSNTEETKR